MPLLVDFLQCKKINILFRVTGGFRIDGKSSLILRESYFLRIFTILYVSGFIVADRNFTFDHLHKKTAKKSENHHRSHKEYRFDF
jgi:hypothetical protein